MICHPFRHGTFPIRSWLKDGGHLQIELLNGQKFLLFVGDGNDGHAATGMGPYRFLCLKVFSAVHVAGDIGILAGQKDMVFTVPYRLLLAQ